MACCGSRDFDKKVVVFCNNCEKNHGTLKFKRFYKGKSVQLKICKSCYVSGVTGEKLMVLAKQKYEVSYGI